MSIQFNLISSQHHFSPPGLNGQQLRVLVECFLWGIETELSPAYGQSKPHGHPAWPSLQRRHFRATGAFESVTVIPRGWIQISILDYFKNSHPHKGALVSVYCSWLPLVTNYSEVIHCFRAAMYLSHLLPHHL